MSTRGLVVLFVGLGALAVLATLLYTGARRRVVELGPTVAGPPLTLPGGRATFRMAQRETRPLPGSRDRYAIHIGDITRGRVAVNVNDRSGRPIAGPTSLRQGEEMAFLLEGKRYGLRVKVLHNRLIGRDEAELEVFRRR